MPILSLIGHHARVEEPPTWLSAAGRLLFVLLLAIPVMAVLIMVLGLALVVVGLASTGIGIVAVPGVLDSAWRSVAVVMLAAAVWLILLGMSWRLWHGRA